MKWIPFAVALLVWGCEEQPVTPLSEMSPAWTDDEAWTIVPQPIQRIGSVDGDSTQIFVDVTQVILLPEGRVAVADNGTGTVRVFDEAGQLLTSFGRKGDGPGEFRHLSTVSTYRGDSLLTSDVRRDMVSIWSMDGDLGRTMRLPDAHMRRVPLVLEDGRLLLTPAPEQRTVATVRQPSLDAYLDSVRPLIVSPEGVLVDSLPPLPYGYVQSLSIRGVGPALLLPQANITAGVDRVLWGWQERFEITEISLSGEVLRVFKRPYDRIAVTEEVRDSLIDEWVSTSYRGRLRPRDARKVLEPMMRGDSLPTFSNSLLHRIQVDHKGNLWVPSFQIGLTTPRDWTVFSEGGKWLGQVAGVPGLRIFDIGSDRVVGLIRDEFDVQYVQVHRIVKLAGGTL